MTVPTRHFTITRQLSAPRKLVWQAWTDPEQLTRWFGPRGLHSPLASITADVREGGSWTITMIHDGDGTEYPQTFTYREVVEPERLVFSAVVSGGIHSESALISVTLAATSTGTELTFTVAGLPDDDSSSGLEEGWSSSFERLTEVVEARSTLA
jgi:uncharacterized protein YndB with AHSA1/START domain